jgi:hypothetical protein
VRKRERILGDKKWNLRADRKSENEHKIKKSEDKEKKKMKNWAFFL